MAIDLKLLYASPPIHNAQNIQPTNLFHLLPTDLFITLFKAFITLNLFFNLLTTAPTRTTLTPSLL